MAQNTHKNPNELCGVLGPNTGRSCWPHTALLAAPQVSVLVPECGVLPQDLRGLLSKVGPYFSVRSLPLCEFITPEFISKFVKGGECHRHCRPVATTHTQPSASSGGHDRWDCQTRGALAPTSVEVGGAGIGVPGHCSSGLPLAARGFPNQHLYSSGLLSLGPTASLVSGCGHLPRAHTLERGLTCLSCRVIGAPARCKPVRGPS